jgi:choline-sulfatase
VSRALHRPAEGGRGVRLPARAATAVYLRVPQSGRLDLEWRAADATLSIAVDAEDGTDQVLRRGDDPAGGSRSVSLDLTRWARQLVRLRLRPEPLGASIARDVTVERLMLYAPAEAAPHAPRAASVERPSVVVYLIDTLRADHLGCYGYDRPTSPRIDAFARSAIVFTDAVAQSSWTLPSTASVLTGLTPRRHGALGVATAIRPDVPTLAEQFRRAGYRTAAFVTNYLASTEFGLARGFDHFRLYREEAERRPGVYLPSSALRRRVRRWLVKAAGQGPFFLYVHAADTHWPYLPAARHARPFRPAGMTDADERRVVDESRGYYFGNEHQGERPTSMPPDRVALLRDLYDGDVRAADEGFGAFLDDLDALGLAPHTVVVLTADHGEEFGEHEGLGHGQTLYREVLQVPLLVRLPGDARAGARVGRTVQHVDIAPTLLDLAGLLPPDGLEGSSLLADAPEQRDAVSQLDYFGIAYDSITTSRWKAIRDLSGMVPGPAPIAVYDRERDPGELRDVADAHAVIAGYARQQLRAAAAGARRGPEVSPDKLERLRALGYLEP